MTTTSADKPFTPPHPRAPGTWIHNAKQVRPSLATVELHGTSVECVYEVEGQYMPATESDPAELPMAVVIQAEIGGVDVTDLMDATGLLANLSEAIERQWGF